MLQDYTGKLTGDEQFVKDVNERGWLLTVLKRPDTQWFIAEIHNVPEGAKVYHGPIGHCEGRNLIEVCRDAYLIATGALKPWAPPMYEG
jgi:hypothetical protein